MSKVKWMAVEFTPNENQVGMSHSWSAKAVVDNVITNKQLAEKVAARGISRAAEIKMVLEEVANIIFEEACENNRVQLESADGVLVTIAPKVSGSVSDATVRANPEKYGGAQTATEEMLTADMLTWGLSAQVGTKLNKQFALSKQAQKVKTSTAATEAAEEPQNGGENGQNGDNGSGDLEG